MAKRRRTGQRKTEYRTVTARAHVPRNADAGTRILKSCHQQTAAENTATGYLIDNPDEPVRKNRKEGQVGLYGRWPEWCEAKPHLAEIPQTIWRAGVSKAKARSDQWQETNADHAAIVVARSDADKHLPRKVQRRAPDPRTLFRRRKQTDARRSNRVHVLEGVKRIDDHHVRIRGIGIVPTRDVVPEDRDLRAATIVERTPAARGPGRTLKPEDRSWVIHLHYRVPAAPEPAAPKTSIGGDHGIVHAVTTADNQGRHEHLQHDRAEIEASQRKAKKLHRQADRQCKRRSRKWKQRKTAACKVRSRQLGRNQQRRLQWANRMAKQYDMVCIEDLQIRNLMASAKGTSENAGKNVGAKRGLSNKWAGIAPGRQSREVENACLRHGACCALVEARNTSTTCSACSAVDPKSRESQARFRCTRCGFEANADANAGENVRQRGVAMIRARVRGSRGNPKRQAPRRNGRTATQAPRGGAEETWTVRKTEGSERTGGARALPAPEAETTAGKKTGSRVY